MIEDASSELDRVWKASLEMGASHQNYQRHKSGNYNSLVQSQPSNDALSSQFVMDQNHSIHPDDLSNCSNVVNNGDFFQSGIIIKSRTSQFQPSWLNSGQGTAQRRLRTQCKLQIGPMSCKLQPLDVTFNIDEQKSESVVTEV